MIYCMGEVRPNAYTKIPSGTLSGGHMSPPLRESPTYSTKGFFPKFASFLH